MFQIPEDPNVKYNVAFIGIISGVLGSIVTLIGYFLTTRYQKRLAELENSKLVQQAEIARQQSELERLKLRQQREMVELTNKLQEQNAERDARRDYEYEARKRLYQQCEPLLFQLVEHSESGRKRIRSLARTARQGNLSLNWGEGWLHNERNYYLESTVYKLLAPLVVFRIIQQKLTLVDLTVDPHINRLYFLSKRLFLSFTDDYKFAETEPRIEYDPNAEVTLETRRNHPEKFRNQGLFIGTLEKVVDKMIVAENQNQRCMNYGEFAAAYCTDEGISHSFIEVAGLFKNFHPKTRPVLWRLLITQAHIYDALIRARELKMSESEIKDTNLLKPMSDKKRTALDWRDPGLKVEDEEVFQPFGIAQRYLEENLKDLYQAKL